MAQEKVHGLVELGTGYDQSDDNDVLSDCQQVHSKENCKLQSLELCAGGESQEDELMDVGIIFLFHDDLEDLECMRSRKERNKGIFCIISPKHLLHTGLANT